MEEAFYRALRRTACVIEKAEALGKSNQLCSSVYEEMIASKKLFAGAGIHIPRRVTKTQEVYFSKLVKPVQEWTIICMNVMRFHEEADELAPYLIKTQLPDELSAETLETTLELVESCKEVFGLDRNGFPINMKVNSCPMRMFEKKSVRNYIFVDDIQEFWRTPTPRTKDPVYYSLRATASTFINKLHSANIMFAY